MPKSTSVPREFRVPSYPRLCNSSVVLSPVLRAQTFALVLDTGSSDLWFATTGCSDCSSSTPLLDPTKSSSFQSTGQTIPLSYGSGNATGTIAHDTVSVGPFTVTPQTFGEQLLPCVLRVSDVWFRVAILVLSSCVVSAQVIRSGGQLIGLVTQASQALGARVQPTPSDYIYALPIIICIHPSAR